MARAAAALLALASAPQDISVPAAALALTAHAPTVEVTTDDGFLALVRKARPLQFARTVSRRTTWSGLTEPSLPPPANVEIDVPSASLTLTGYAPTVEVTDDLPDLLIPPRWSVRSVQRVAPRGGSASARWLMLLAPALTTGGSPDVTVGLTGQAVTVSAGTITAEVPAAPSEPQYARGGGGGRGFDAKEAARKRKRDEALEATIRQMYRELTQEPATAELAAEVVAPITAPTAAKIPSTASVAFEKATTEIEIALRMLHGEIASLRKQREADEDEAREILEILDLID